MQPFPLLLRALISRRYKTDAEFAQAVGLKPPFVSRVANGHKAPPLKSVDVWADALGIDGQAREEFILAAEIANSPARVGPRLDELEELIRRQARELAEIKEKTLKALLRARSARPAARRPKR